MYADLVTIGHVVRPQGRRGEILTLPLSDRPGRYEGLARVFVPGPAGTAREVVVHACWRHKGRVVLKLEGVDSIEAAEALRGVDLRIPESDLPSLPAGTYYHHQLKGLAVRDEAGRSRGRVVDVLETGGTAVLKIARGITEDLVPLATDFVKRVDLAAAVVVVRFPDMEADDASD